MGRFIREGSGRFGESCYHQSVPRGENLIVRAGADAHGAGSVKFGVRFAQLGGDSFRVKFEARGEGGIIQGALKNSFAFPVSFGCDSICCFEKSIFITKDVLDLILCPNIEFTFLVFRICIERGIEAALFICHFICDEIQCLLHDAFVKRIVRHLPGVEIDASQQGIIVQHFFVMVYPIVQTELCFQHGYQSVVMA